MLTFVIHVNKNLTAINNSTREFVSFCDFHSKQFSSKYL